MSYFDDQEDAWFDGGLEWYCKNNNIDPDKYNGGIPGDFDPYEFWNERENGESVDQ